MSKPYIPLVGTLYSFKRANIAHVQDDDKRFWISLANFAEGAVRDVVLYAELVEPAPVVIIHTMAESLTDKLIDIYTSDSPTKIKVQQPIDKTQDHVLIAGKTQEQTDKVAAELFKSKAKGIQHFHGSVFTGTLVEEKYAPNGEKIWLYLPEGLYDGAMCTSMWRWTTSPPWHALTEHTHGHLDLVPGSPTTFQLRLGWKGLRNFHGSVTDKDTIQATMRIEDKDVVVTLTRQLPPRSSA
ncbi:hypothetical protein C8Q74DRAFT_1439795 [Fomes fomentarius]|nr:hypothetical protein C8Q74DRAFT_1439795 [Fomes fomentarius]